jgi:MoaA/NifB/PqqE/SkfB family radical SAM enzyme
MRTFPDLLTFGVSAPFSALAAKRVLSCLWELTYRCTARCGICPYWKHPSDPKQELQLPQIQEGLHKIHAHGCRAVNFTGGEPTLRRDLEHIIRYASHLGMWTSVVTNGSLLTRQRVRDVKDAGLDNLLVSLDSLDPAIHDRQRGIPGLHSKVVQCANWIHEEFLTGHRTGGVMTVLTNLNIADVNRIVQFADELGVYVLMQPYHEKKTESAEFNPEISDTLGEALVDVRRTRKNILNSERYLRALPRFYDDARQQPCHAGRKYFSIDPYGRLHPCVDMPSVGHLLQDDISVVRSPAAMQSVASCRGCWYCFRGESDVSLSFGGCLDKLRLGIGVVLHNYRRKGKQPSAE